MQHVMCIYECFMYVDQTDKQWTQGHILIYTLKITLVRWMCYTYTPNGLARSSAFLLV